MNLDSRIYYARHGKSVIRKALSETVRQSRAVRALLAYLDAFGVYGPDRRELATAPPCWVISIDERTDQ